MFVNIKSRVEKGKLILEIDLGQDYGLSGTGKSHIVGSSGGFYHPPDAPESIMVNLNVIKTNRNREAA